MRVNWKKLERFVTHNQPTRSLARCGQRYSFIPATLANARIQRVLAVSRGRVMVEFGLGTFRVQTILKVPDDELAHFLLDCEKKGALKGLVVRPAFIPHAIPQARTIRRLLGGDSSPADSSRHQ